MKNTNPLYYLTEISGDFAETGAASYRALKQQGLTDAQIRQIMVKDLQNARNFSGGLLSFDAVRPKGYLYNAAKSDVRLANDLTTKRAMDKVGASLEKINTSNDSIRREVASNLNHIKSSLRNLFMDPNANPASLQQVESKINKFKRLIIGNAKNISETQKAEINAELQSISSQLNRLAKRPNLAGGEAGSIATRLTGRIKDLYGVINRSTDKYIHKLAPEVQSALNAGRHMAAARQNPLVFGLKKLFRR